MAAIGGGGVGAIHRATSKWGGVGGKGLSECSACCFIIFLIQITMACRLVLGFALAAPCLKVCRTDAFNRNINILPCIFLTSVFDITKWSQRIEQRIMMWQRKNQGSFFNWWLYSPAVEFWRCSGKGMYSPWRVWEKPPAGQAPDSSDLKWGDVGQESKQTSTKFRLRASRNLWSRNKIRGYRNQLDVWSDVLSTTPIEYLIIKQITLCNLNFAPNSVWKERPVSHHQRGLIKRHSTTISLLHRISFYCFQNWVRQPVSMEIINKINNINL